jgi:hypothetical protein
MAALGAPGPGIGHPSSSIPSLLGHFVGAAGGSAGGERPGEADSQDCGSPAHKRYRWPVHAGRLQMVSPFVVEIFSELHSKGRWKADVSGERWGCPFWGVLWPLTGHLNAVEAAHCHVLPTLNSCLGGNESV